MRLAESEAAPGAAGATTFPSWLREQQDRPDAVGAGARVLLRLAGAPGAGPASIGQLLELAAGLPARRYLGSVPIETGSAWREQAGGLRTSVAVLGVARAAPGGHRRGGHDRDH